MNAPLNQAEQAAVNSLVGKYTDFAEEGKVTLKIYDLLGELVTSKEHRQMIEKGVGGFDTVVTGLLDTIKNGKSVPATLKYFLSKCKIKIDSETGDITLDTSGAGVQVTNQAPLLDFLFQQESSTQEDRYLLDTLKKRLKVQPGGRITIDADGLVADLVKTEDGRRVLYAKLKETWTENHGVDFSENALVDWILTLVPQDKRQGSDILGNFFKGNYTLDTENGVVTFDTKGVVDKVLTTTPGLVPAVAHFNGYNPTLVEELIKLRNVSMGDRAVLDEGIKNLSKHERAVFDQAKAAIVEKVNSMKGALDQLPGDLQFLAGTLKEETKDVSLVTTLGLEGGIDTLALLTAKKMAIRDVHNAGIPGYMKFFQESGGWAIWDFFCAQFAGAAGMPAFERKYGVPHAMRGIDEIHAALKEGFPNLAPLVASAVANYTLTEKMNINPTEVANVLPGYLKIGNTEADTGQIVAKDVPIRVPPLQPLPTAVLQAQPQAPVAEGQEASKDNQKQLAAAAAAAQAAKPQKEAPAQGTNVVNGETLSPVPRGYAGGYWFNPNPDGVFHV